MAVQTANKEYGLLIDGVIVPSNRSRCFERINPSTGEVFAYVADAAVQDMDKAIQSARNAFDNGMWPSMSSSERGIYLKKIAEAIRTNAKELADIECRDTGKPIKHTTFIDVPTAADTFDYFSDVEQWLKDQKPKVNAPVDSMMVYEPRGVAGCIIPWNYPLIFFAWKTAPALAAGNTVILKPSPGACASIMRLAEIIKDIELPKGVLNIVSSSKVETAARLVESDQVDMISFTGGTATGREIMRLAANTTKKIALELGGKSPNIVFADCDIETAVSGTMSAIFMNQGQMCTAGSRLLIEESIYDVFVEKLITATKKIKIGNAEDSETAFGPLIGAEHRDQLLKDIKAGIEEGAVLAYGGKIPEGKEFQKGAYLEPTILTGVTNDMKVAQEEIFGPVLCVMKFKCEEEAIRIANDTKYGLAATIWSKDLDKANTVAKKLQCGTVWVNTYGGFFNEISFGGYKQSGFGYELGQKGLLEYMHAKHICIDKTPGGTPLVAAWF